MNNIDDIFHRRLTDHTLQPSRLAWEKIENNLLKKNKLVIPFRWAAVMIPAGVIITTIALFQKDKPTVITQNQNNIVSPAPTDLHPLITENNKHQSAPVRKQKRKIKSKQVESVAEQSPQEKVVAQVPDEAVIIKKETQTPVNSIVLTYTLDPVSTPVVAERTADAVEDKPLKKVVDFAKNVKGGDTSVGLKVIREDLMAHDKKKTTHKTN